MEQTPHAHSEETEKYLQIIKKTDPDFSYKNWIEAATYFQKSAEKGVDISDVVEDLKDTYHQCNNVYFMTPAAKALVYHYLNKNDIESVEQLVAKATYPSYFLTPIQHYYEKKIVPSKVLCFVFPHLEKHKFILQDILKFHITAQKENQEARIEEIIQLFKTHYQNETAHSRWLMEIGVLGIDISKPLLELLNWLKDEKNKKTIASDLGWGNLSGLDLSKIRAELMPFLEDDSINEQLAFSLARSAAQQGDFENLELGLQHPAILVQKGTILGINAYAMSISSVDYRFTHLVIKSLNNASDLIQNITYNALLVKKHRGFSLLPNDTDLDWLVETLANTKDNRVIIPYLIKCFLEEKTWIQKIIKKIQNPKNQQIELLEICNNFQNKTHTFPCSICEEIPREQSYGDYNGGVQLVKKLLPKVDISQPCPKTILTCPECSNIYLYENIQENDYDRMGTNYDITLKRLLSSEKLAYLDKNASENFHSTLSTRLEQYRCDLENPVAYLATDAAYALLIYYINTSDFNAIKTLLSHPNEKVVLTVLESLNKWNIHKAVQTTEEFILCIENCIYEFSKNTAIQQIAALIANEYALYKNNKEKVLYFLEHPCNPVKKGAFKAISVSYYVSGINLIPYLPQLIAAFENNDNDIQSVAKFILSDLIEQKKQNFDAKSTILQLLQDKDINKQKHGLYLLNTYITASQDYRFAISWAGQALTNDELVYYAMTVCKTIPSNNKELQTELLPYLEKRLKTRKEAFIYDLFNILVYSYNEGNDLTELLPEIVAWLNLYNKKYRYNAVGILTIARKKGVNLSFAEKELVAANLKNADSYDQDITYILMDIYLKNNNYEAINALLTDRSRSCRSAAIAYINMYPQKSSVDISGFIQALVGNLKHDYFYLKEEAKKAVTYFQNRSEKDRQIIDNVKI